MSGGTGLPHWRSVSPSSSSVAMSAAAGFPSWVLLEPFVFRRDDDKSFPDETKAPIRASATTSWGARFRVAFSLADPPHISRLYAQLPEPGFPPKNTSIPLRILATHRHLALLPVSTYTPSEELQNLFILRANPSKSSLQALPPCTEPEIDYFSGGDECLHDPPSEPTPRRLDIKSLGLWCGDKEEFVVAELTLDIPRYRSSKAFADICMLCGNCTAPSALHQVGGRWKSMRVEILPTGKPADYDLWKLCSWQTDTVIPFKQWLCWIDYHQGILFCDMSKLPTPTVSLLWFPLDKSPRTSTRTFTRSRWYSGVSVVHYGRALKFANVAHHCGLASGAPKPRDGFTITCHTLELFGSMVWIEDYTVTSDDLGGSNLPECLQCGTLTFPRVDIDRPHVVHFLSFGFGAYKKMWVVSIDMSTKTVESSYLYMNGTECLKTDDADFISKKSTSPLPFLPSDFPRFCYLSGK